MKSGSFIPYATICPAREATLGTVLVADEDCTCRWWSFANNFQELPPGPAETASRTYLLRHCHGLLTFYYARTCFTEYAAVSSAQIFIIDVSKCRLLNTWNITSAQVETMKASVVTGILASVLSCIDADWSH